MTKVLHFHTIILLVYYVAHHALGCAPTITTVEGPRAPIHPLCSGQLIFSENFDELNSDTWIHEERMSANGEFQWYTASENNSYTENGILYLRPTLTTDLIPDITNCHIVIPENCQAGICEHTCSAEYPAPPVQSARIKTNGTFSFRYGRVEVRARTPTGDWLFPAIWLMPTHNKYGMWPRSGEIDVMESRGNVNLVNGNAVEEQVGVEQFASTLHFGPDGGHSAWRTAHFLRNSECGAADSWNKRFHSYQIEWRPEMIQFSVDDMVIGTIHTDDGYFKRGNFTGENLWSAGQLDAPYDQPFHFILNLAVGGVSGYFADTLSNKPWRNKDKNVVRDFWNARDKWLPSWQLNANSARDASFQIDYVRAWAL